MGNFITLFVIIILVRLCIKLYRECDQLKSGTNEGLMRAKEELRRAQEDLEKAKRDAAKILRDAKKDYESQRSLAISRLKEEIGKTWFQSECSEIKRLKGEINAERERLGKLENIANKSISQKVLAEFVAESLRGFIEFQYETTEYRTVEKYLQSIRGRIKELKFNATYYKYLVFDYWDKYPELKDIEDGDMDAVKDESEEKEYDSDWLTREEWENLSDEDKSQRVLENYINRHNKSKWQIGRDYEMYIAYRCRKQNLFVKATGIEQRLEDLGRDIIAKSLDGKTYIIQCKCWSKEKLIREKHIAQIFGTAKEYEFSTGSLPGMVVPVLYSTTEFSETARRFAQMLGVQLKTEPLAEFPRIKCNIGSRGDKIFHLPIDQQYDTTVIEPEKGECYAWTVKEAMSRGFRRAIRHRPPSRG